MNKPCRYYFGSGCTKFNCHFHHNIRANPNSIFYEIMNDMLLIKNQMGAILNTLNNEKNSIILLLKETLSYKKQQPPPIHSEEKENNINVMEKIIHQSNDVLYNNLIKYIDNCVNSQTKNIITNNNKTIHMQESIINIQNTTLNNISKEIKALPLKQQPLLLRNMVVSLQNVLKPHQKQNQLKKEEIFQAINELQQSYNSYTKHSLMEKNMDSFLNMKNNLQVLDKHILLLNKEHIKNINDLKNITQQLSNIKTTITETTSIISQRLSKIEQHKLSKNNVIKTINDISKKVNEAVHYLSAEYLSHNFLMQLSSKTEDILSKQQTKMKKIIHNELIEINNNEIYLNESMKNMESKFKAIQSSLSKLNQLHTNNNNNNIECKDNHESVMEFNKTINNNELLYVIVSDISYNINLIYKKIADSYAPLPTFPKIYNELMLISDKFFKTKKLAQSYEYNKKDGNFTNYLIAKLK